MQLFESESERAYIRIFSTWLSIVRYMDVNDLLVQVRTIIMIFSFSKHGVFFLSKIFDSYTAYVHLKYKYSKRFLTQKGKNSAKIIELRRSLTPIRSVGQIRLTKYLVGRKWPTNWKSCNLSQICFLKPTLKRWMHSMSLN